jgi:Ca2+-binding EF-hand superfamily protein
MARWIGTGLIVLTASFMLGGVQAQDGQKKKLDAAAIFMKLDTNSDGKLSKDEFLKLADNFKNRDKAREKLGTSFERFATNKMGLTQDQFKQYLDSVKKKSDARTGQI